jgi:MFS transporter, DHA1 family, multidrug resistance protein
MMPLERRDGFSLATIVLLGALGTMGPLSIDMYLPALPTIGAALTGDPAGAQRSLAAYFAGLAIGGLVAGPISDRWGRYRPLAIGLLTYIAGSLGCALAADTGTLTAWRFVQALGGATAMVIPRALVRDRQTGAAAVHTMAMLMLVGAAAPIVAPMLGGMVLHWFGWRSIFVILASVGTALLAASLFVFRHAAAVPHPVPIAGGKIRGLLRDRSYLAYTAGGTLGGAAMFAYISGSPFVFITLHGVDPGHFGWFFGANALALVSAAQLSRFIIRWMPPHRLVRLASRGAALSGLLLLACAVSGAGGLWGVSVPLILLLGCLGLIGPSAGVLALDGQGERAGLASAIGGSFGFVLAASASWLVDALHDGSARPMAGTVAAFACCAALVIAWAPIPAHERS